MYQNQNYGNTPYGLPAYGDLQTNGSNRSGSSPYGTNSFSSSSASDNGGGGSNLMSRCDESSALSLIQHLDKNDLQHLHDNDSKLQDLIDDLPQVKNIEQERDQLIATNKSLAEYNLSLQPKLEEIKHIVAADYEKVNALKTTLAEDKTRLDGFVGKRSLDTLLALLQTEAAKSEEESEDLVTNFFDNGIDMEEFLNQYLPQRAEAHLRRIKSERMAELIRENQYSNWAGSSSSNPPAMNAAPYPSNSAATGVPYPTSAAFGMPQPGNYLH